MDVFERLRILREKPTAEPRFKIGDKVYSPIGEMIIIDNHFGAEFSNDMWIPKCLLGFTNKDGSLNKQKKHRTFCQNRLSLNPL